MKKFESSQELNEAVSLLRPFFLRAGLFSVVASLLILMPSWYMLEVYDRVVNSGNHMTLAMVTLLVLAAFALMELLEWARSTLLHDAGLALDKRLRRRVFTAMFEANLRKRPGGTQQAMADLRTLREFFALPVVPAVMEAPIALLFAILIFMISPLLGWVSVIAAIIQVFVGWLNERSTQPPLAEANRAAQRAQIYADGTLRNAQVIESMGMVRDIHQRWIAKQREFLNLQAVASDSGGGYQATSKFLQNVVTSALLGLSAWLLLHGQLNGGSGMLIVAGILGGRVLAPLVQIVTQWRSVVNVREAWGRLSLLLLDVPARQPSMALPAPRGSVQVDNLMAAAPGSPTPILKGLNFVLSPGEVLAVVGPSAAGKSTLARLLVGVWPAMSGKVRLDGVDVYAWDKLELGEHIGYLPQGVELLEGTLAENIARFGEPQSARVMEAAKTVGLHDLIMALPDGYETQIGRDGGVLSGGQRQRVGLARALYGDPVYVVLDEPNSSLDETGDAALSKAISEMKSRGTTFVVMTHRTSVLAVTDKMLLLRDGAQQAFGPRDEVIAALNKANAKSTASEQA